MPTTARYAEPCTIINARLFDGAQTLAAGCLRIAGDRITALGAASIREPGDTVLDAQGGTLLPGLIDAHVHLLPGCTQLAANFGVTTLVDQFSKPEVIEPELAAARRAAEGHGPARADLRTSSIGATAPNGHPTLAYAPFPYVTRPADAEPFVHARIAEGATHLKVIYDDGSGLALDIPALEVATIEALVSAAHRAELPVVAHVSTAAGAVLVARCGVDVLAHVPFDPMSDAQVHEVAQAGLALIATLSVTDGFPSPGGELPLATEPALAPLLPPAWRQLLAEQAQRWMPPTPPDAASALANTRALAEAGVRVLAGTDAPNPGLVPGASLHRELAKLVRAGLAPAEALAAATSRPAEVFGLADRGRLQVGARADLLLVDGDPSTNIADSQRLRSMWVAGRAAQPEAYPGSAAEEAGLAWLRACNAQILRGIRELWPELPEPE
ncbi:imidazolonepropionase-like amidohydrolase [Tamaricihabitans halophyticus]|uniref:Imidazolonepropionase-like amidohydrolase n=1 Tax=Tamaricihabitans halophyticus TaxID=1262583 RepID=A0A4R2RDB8_9PSEU|nr:amidohydrolase family protein [Tamaricihabitans halophyticus]TCP57405.1 imidazolonepropionase-like amidohydrolase [Tamaricihabitans halophyticus]